MQIALNKIELLIMSLNQYLFYAFQHEKQRRKSIPERRHVSQTNWRMGVKIEQINPFNSTIKLLIE